MARVKGRRQRGSTLSEINIVPYIDVMLVLLVIFMITTPMLSEGVTVKLPQAQAKALKAQPAIPIIVSVDAKGLFYLNSSHAGNTPLSGHQLALQVAAELELAKKKGTQRDVLVKADEGVQYGQVMNAMVLLQQSGVENVGLMTRDTRRKEA